MSSKSASQIFKILYQTGNRNIFVFCGVFFSRYVQLKNSFSDEKITSGKVLKENSIIGRSWSSFKLFIMESYTDNPDRSAPLTVENMWCFEISFEIKMGLCSFRKKNQNWSIVFFIKNYFYWVSVFKINFYDYSVNQMSQLTKYHMWKWITVLNEAYHFVERRVKLNNKAPFHRKFLIVFADDIGLSNYWKWFSTIRRYVGFF